MWKLETNTGVISIGVVSIVLALAFTVAPYVEFWDKFSLFILEFLGGAGLFLGVYKRNHLFFLPWLIFTGFCMFVLLYTILISLATTSDFKVLLFLLSYLGIFFVSFLSVIQAFNRIRKERAATGNTCDV